MSPALVVYYHLLFELSDVRTAAVLAQLLQNTQRLNEFAKSDEKVLHYLEKAQSALSEGSTNTTVLESEFVKPEVDDVRTELVGRLVYVKHGDMMDPSTCITRLRQNMQRSEIDAEAVEHYLIPTYDSRQPVA